MSELAGGGGVKGERERERIPSQVDSALNLEPDTGLNLVTPRP